LETGEEPTESAQVEKIDEGARRAVDHQAEAIEPGNEREPGERIDRPEVDGPGVARIAGEVHPGPGPERQVRALAAIDDAAGRSGIDGAR